MQGVSLGCFFADNSMRITCHRIAQSAVFDIAIMLLIIFSTAITTLESPLADP